MALKQQQLVTGNKRGDCFRACLANILEIPIEQVPNYYSRAWYLKTQRFLRQYGLSLMWDKNKIWYDGYWIASVKSLNYKDTYHAIVMDGQCVFFDPSKKKKYEEGENLLGSDAIDSGWHLVVDDITKIHRLNNSCITSQNIV